MGSSVLLVFVLPILIIDFIDTHLGTDLYSLFLNASIDIMENLVDSGIAETFSNVITEIFEKL